MKDHVDKQAAHLDDRIAVTHNNSGIVKASELRASKIEVNLNDPAETP